MQPLPGFIETPDINIIYATANYSTGYPRAAEITCYCYKHYKWKYATRGVFHCLYANLLNKSSKFSEKIANRYRELQCELRVCKSVELSFGNYIFCSC